MNFYLVLVTSNGIELKVVRNPDNMDAQKCRRIPSGICAV